MPEKATNDPSEDFSLEYLMHRFERDLKGFKKNVDGVFCEHSD